MIPKPTFVLDPFFVIQGGMKAVIMTDSFQSVVLIGSLAAVLAMASTQVGGFDVVWDHAWQTGRLHFFE